MAEKTKQALKALEKNDFSKVEEILRKSDLKEPHNPATNFIWARLYSTEIFERYDIDTAHHYIVLACENIKRNNEDYLEELDDADLFEFDLTNKKISIDRLASNRAREIHSIEGYNHFIGNFKDAIGHSEAILARDQLVFDEIVKENSWKGYRKFMNDYPNAEQYGQSKIRYDKLIFEEKTKSGKVEDFVQFLIDEPQTPYRFHLESLIFAHHISLLEPMSIRNFLDNYKNKTLVHRALSMLYYLDSTQYQTVVSYDHTDFKAFQDSISLVQQVNKFSLIPMFDKTFYRFINLDGEVVLADSVSKIDDNFLCRNQKADWLQVMQRGQMNIINRLGDLITSEADGQVKDLGVGLLAVEKEGLFGLYHKGGFELLTPAFDDLKLEESQFLLFEVEGKVGVMGVDGHQYVPPVYDHIYLEGSFWVFQKEELFGVSNSDQFLKSTLQRPFAVALNYEEIELINSKYVIGYKEQGEELIGSDLKIKTMSGTQRINTKFESWVVEQEDGYQIFDKDLGQLSGNVFDEVRQNEEWLGLKRNNKWFVYNRTIYDEPIIGVDSLKLLGQDIAIVFRGESGVAIFPNKKLVGITQGEYLRSISSDKGSTSHFLVIQRRGQRMLYRDGEKLFDYDCDELGYISDSVFYVKINGKYGAVDSNGRLLMRIKYDAISQATNGVSDVLFNGKFGAYNFRERILLKLDFGEKLKNYNESLFLVKEEDKYGLLDRFNQMILTPTYDEINYWSDSTFLGKLDGQWQLVKMEGRSILLSGIDYYEYLKNEPEEKIILIRRETGYGVYHTGKGMVVPSVFHDVINLGDDHKQLYFTETSVPEAGYYVVVYYDSEGNKLHSMAYTEKQYARIVCDQ